MRYQEEVGKSHWEKSTPVYEQKAAPSGRAV